MDTIESKVGETFLASIVAVADGDVKTRRMPISANTYEDILGLDCQNDYIWGVIKVDPLTIAITAQATGGAAGGKLVGLLRDGTKFMGQVVTWHNRAVARPGRRLQCPSTGRGGALLPLADSTLARVISWHIDEVVIEFPHLKSERTLETYFPRDLFNIDEEPLNINTKDETMADWTSTEGAFAAFSPKKDDAGKHRVLDKETGALKGALGLTLTSSLKQFLGGHKRVKVSFDADWIVLEGTADTPKKKTRTFNYALTYEPQSGLWKFALPASLLPWAITRGAGRYPVEAEVSADARRLRVRLDLKWRSINPQQAADVCGPLEPLTEALAEVKVAEVEAALVVKSKGTPATVASRMTELRAIEAWLVEHGECHVDPAVVTMITRITL